MQNNSMILDSYTEIEEIFLNNQIKKPFLCCGKSFEQTKMFRYFICRFDLTVWDDIRPNPRFEDMVRAAELFKKNGCDFMIGAGGGSSLDSAKMIKLMITNPAEDCLAGNIKDNAIPFWAIPTTAGSGSEATKYSVFYKNDTEKHSVSHDGFLPDYVILEPTLLKTLPDYQRKCTCMDALCHAIESYWNIHSSQESKSYAQKAIRLFFENKESYLKNEDAGNRGMLEASYYAGKAINLTATTSAHALSYNLTVYCHISHGHSVSVNLAEIWRRMAIHNDKINDKRGHQYVLNTFDEIAKLMGGKNTREGIQIFQNLLDEFNLHSPSAKPEQLADFVSSINLSRLQNNPVAFDSHEIEAIYKNVLRI